MIEPKDIKITSDLFYDGAGLTAGYGSPTKTGIAILSDEQLMNGLQATGLIHRFKLKERTIITPSGRYYTLDDFMGLYLSVEMAQAVIADFLNNQTDKESGNYKTYTI